MAFHRRRRRPPPPRLLGRRALGGGGAARRPWLKLKAGTLKVRASKWSIGTSTLIAKDCPRLAQVLADVIKSP